MEPNTPSQTPAPVPPSLPPLQAKPITPVTPPTNHKKVGPIIAALIIVLILVIAAVYVFASRLNTQDAPTDITTYPHSTEQVQTNTTANSNNPQTVQPIRNESDDVTSLNTDLETSTDGLDSQNF